METKPKYNEFLKSWSSENKITSFFGSDKPEFLKDWNQAKMGKVEPAVKPVVEPVFEPEQKAKVDDTIFSNGRFFKVVKLTPKTVSLKPLDEIIIEKTKDPKSKGDAQNEYGIQILKAGNPLDEDTQYGKTRTKLITGVNMIKRNTITQKYDSYDPT